MEKLTNVKVDFSGGLDLVFDDRREMTLQIEGEPKLSKVIEVLGTKHANAKRDMFYYQQKIKPGILVLINEVDWQLADKQDTILQSGDKISFISTLHGG